jgi:general secretion pathway protein A
MDNGRMYLKFFGLTEAPFAITPDPRFVFLSDRHRDALAHLAYGVGQGGGSGFVQLTGEVGTGKTTLSRLLLEQLPEDAQAALVLNPKLTPLELLQTIGEELHLKIGKVRSSAKGLIDVLNAHLLAQHAAGKRVVLIIDEAQNLSTEALEQVRLLTNLETGTQKLLQIILIGQPELRDLLDRPDLRNLAQRVTARYHLTPLDAAETGAYLRHRLNVAGCAQFPFTQAAVRAIAQRSGGVPRLINIIADRALLAGYVHDEPRIGPSLVRAAHRDALGARPLPWRPWALAASLLLATLAAAWAWSGRTPGAAGTADATGAATASPPPATTPLAVANHATRFGTLPGDDTVVFKSLLTRWNASPSGADFDTLRRCTGKTVGGLRCVAGSGSLARVAALDRPMLLRLRVGGRAASALLLGLDGDQATLDFGDGEPTPLARAELERYWFGDYAVLYQVPLDLPDLLTPGSSGMNVVWLRRLMARFDGNDPPTPNPQLFDADLGTRVKHLQEARGLHADGVVGADTVLALAAYDPVGPHLTPARPRQKD